MSSEYLGSLFPLTIRSISSYSLRNVKERRDFGTYRICAKVSFKHPFLCIQQGFRYAVFLYLHTLCMQETNTLKYS